MPIRLISLLLLLYLTVSRAQAVTYYVALTGNDANSGTQSQPFRTIQKGLDTAANGDTVLVANGRYTGGGNFNLTFNSKNLTLRSQGGSANCIVECNDGTNNLRRAFLFTGGETSSAVLDGFTITGGLDPVEGGGMYISGASPTISNCVFTENTVNGVGDSSSFAGYGGALSVRGNSSPVVSRCTFSRNRAFDTGGSFGGAMFIACVGTLTLSDCTITDNTASAQFGFGSGGGLDVYSGTVRLINCVVAKNRARGDQSSTGGGLSVSSAGGIVATNCTFTGNDAYPSPEGNGGGGVDVHSGTAELTNCIVYGNTSVNNVEISVGGTVNVTYSDVRGGFAGQGNINADPLFVDAAAGNYRLQTGSPCISAGSNTVPNLPAFDITGLFPRAFGGKVEIGAYEYIEPNALFVDRTTGSDTNPGTAIAPFRTVARALTAATDPTKSYAIYIAAGNYGTDRPRITKSVRFFFWGNTGQARIGKP